MLKRGARVAGSFFTRNRLVLASAMKTLAGSMSARAATMVSALGAAGLLGAEGYGTFAFLLATVGLSSGVGQLGIGPIVSREIARAPRSDAAGYASVALVTTAAASAATAVVSLFAIASFDIGGVAGIVDGWIWLGIIAWTMSSCVSTIAQAILVGRQWFSSAAVMMALRSLSVAAATILGALSGDIFGTALFVLTTECAVALGTLIYLSSRGLIQLGMGAARAYADAARIMRTGSSAGFASLLVQLSLWGGQSWLLSQAGGAAANGAFAVASRIALGASVVPAALTAVLIPILSSGRSDVSRRDSAAMPTIMAALCALGAVLVLPYLLDGWLVDYSSFAIVFYMMLAGIVPMVANETLGAVALAGGHVRAWVASDVVLAVLMAIVYWVLVPSTGAAGFATAHVVGYLASTVVLFWAIKQGGPVSRPLPAMIVEGESRSSGPSC